MIITSSKFVISSPSIDLCPEATMPEFAFIGRSNVGKSSLINYISNNGSLCKTSKVPGKTKLINHFLINNKFFFVDLPGYGYAKVSKASREAWGEFIEDYITTRPTLKKLFVLIDSSISPQKIDLEFVAFCLFSNIDIAIVFTKSDKESKHIIKSNTDNFVNQLRASCCEYSHVISGGLIDNLSYFEVSSSKKKGSSQILDYIHSINNTK